ncbi:MAG: hypothetical protein Q8L71_01450 [Thiobacillus sp.]|nr:hypothetical protein [Thiobacillus sp.]
MAEPAKERMIGAREKLHLHGFSGARTGGANAAVIPAGILGHEGQAVKDASLDARLFFGADEIQ